MISASLVKELREKSGAGMMDCKKALEATDGSIDAAMDWLREKGIAKANKKESRIAAEGLANVYIKGNKAVILEVNSETDFVSKNEEFRGMIDEIGNAILDGEATTVEEVLTLPSSEGTINDLVIAKTAKIGEKLSLRRVEVLTKNDDDNFGSYIHMGGKIAALTVINGGNSDIAKDVAMQSAAMKAEYVFTTDVPEDVVEREKTVLIEEAKNEGKPAEIAEKMVAGRIKKFYKEICLSLQAFIKDGNVDVNTYLANNGAKLINAVRYEVGEGIEKRCENFADEVRAQVSKN